jgi:hypothetical protein
MRTIKCLKKIISFPRLVEAEGGGEPRTPGGEEGGGVGAGLFVLP